MKKLISICLLCFLTVGMLTSCFEEDPGLPTVPQSDRLIWNEQVQYKQNIELDISQAYTVNNELATHFAETMGSITFDEIKYIKDFLRYIGQYKLRVREETIYLHEAEKMLTAQYNLYTGNCTIATTLEAIESYDKTYESLSEDCKENMQKIDCDIMRVLAENITIFSKPAMR